MCTQMYGSPSTLRSENNHRTHISLVAFSHDSSTEEPSPSLLTSHVPHHQHLIRYSQTREKGCPAVILRDREGSLRLRKSMILYCVILKKGLSSPSPTFCHGSWFHLASSQLIGKTLSKRTHLSDAVSCVDYPRYIATLIYTICLVVQFKRRSGVHQKSQGTKLFA